MKSTMTILSLAVYVINATADNVSPTTDRGRVAAERRAHEETRGRTIGLSCRDALSSPGPSGALDDLPTYGPITARRSRDSIESHVRFIYGFLMMSIGQTITGSYQGRFVLSFGPVAFADLQTRHFSGQILAVMPLWQDDHDLHPDFMLTVRLDDALAGPHQDFNVRDSFVMDQEASVSGRQISIRWSELMEGSYRWLDPEGNWQKIDQHINQSLSGRHVQIAQILNRNVLGRQVILAEDRMVGRHWIQQPSLHNMNVTIVDFRDGNLRYKVRDNERPGKPIYGEHTNSSRSGHQPQPETVTMMLGLSSIQSIQNASSIP